MIFSTLFVLVASCGSHIPVPGNVTEPVVVYKTKRDYRAYVSVQLSADGKSVVAYPGTSDVLVQRPIELADGYLLKRMIGDAFLSLTIDAYADTSNIYTVEDLLALLVDREPYLEKYDCSCCTSPDTASINKLIRKGELKNCSSLLK